MSPVSFFARSLGRQLFALVGTIVCVSLLGAAYGIWALSEVDRSTRTLVERSVVTERLVADWYRYVSVAARRTIAIAASADPSLASFFAEESAASSKATSDVMAKIGKLLDDPQEKNLYASIEAVRKDYLYSRDLVAKLKKEGQPELARKTLDERFLPIVGDYLAKLEQLARLQRDQIDTAGREIAALNRNARIALAAFSAGAVLLGGLLGWWLAGRISGPVRDAAEAAQRIARFDLTHEIRTGRLDETGRLLAALGAMQQSLRALVAKVHLSTERINTASFEIADGSVDLSGRTEQAASSLQQTAASIEQVSGTLKQSADGARTASGLADSAAQVALSGGRLVDRVVATMSGINDASRKISDITGVIDGIAFQTNILALNAAVEAARAGEQGRGFAVVAAEVRSLAQRSAQAAREIKALIGSSVEKVEAGSKLVADTGTTMHEIVASAERVSSIIGEISNATDEQSRGVEQVNAAVSQLDRVQQHNAALVEQSSAAAESLKLQARELTETMQQFRL